MKHAATLSAAIFIASAAAFFAGRATAPGRAAERSHEATSQAQARLSDRDRASTPSRAGGASGRSGRDTTSGGPMETPSEEMSRIMRAVDPLARTQAWLDFINTLDPDQFETVVADFRDAGHSREHMAEYAMLLTAWAKTDPLAALDYASAETGNRFARNTILATWSASDPDGAILWAERNHEGEGANPWMVGVIRGIASYDPDRAAELMAGMPYSRERGDALGAVLPQILERGPEAAKAWASAIGDDRLRDGVVQRLAETLARQDPRGTVDWLRSTGGDGAQRSIDDAMGIWAGDDQRAALAYFDSLPGGEIRTSALRGLANQMATQDPQAAADFLDSHVADADDRVYQQFVWHSFGQHPELAAGYIARIGNPREQEGMYRRMLDGWLRQDFDAASSWIQSNPLPEGVANRMDQRIREIQERRQ